MSSKKKLRVVIGISSGVDSSVAAALLKEQGYEVIGVFMHFWKEPGRNVLLENKCCSLESLEEARKICRILNIPLYTANAEKEFKTHVVDYFLREHKKGRTPNPCIACNKHIKFQVLFEKMLELKGDFIATGHYARLRREFPISNSQFPNKSQARISKDKVIYKLYQLYQSKDQEKDQTYFLYNLNQKQLARIMFPVGEYEKSEVRAMAKERGLPVFDKEDSQEICFVPEKCPREFLKRNLKLKRGKIISMEGEILGKHDGLPLYTLGQRKRIGLGGDGPYYVVGKNALDNMLMVANDKEEKLLYKEWAEIEEVSWVREKPKFPAKIKVKTRYRNPMVSAIIEPLKGSSRYKIVFSEPQKAVTPGQSAVFYGDNGEVLGGGIVQ